MKLLLAAGLSLFVFNQGIAQDEISKLPSKSAFTVVKQNKATSVKNQGRTNTCWSFSTTSLLESQVIRDQNIQDIDLSEMYTVYQMYIEKGRNYFLRQGKAQFSEGGLGHDVIRSVELYGAMPDKEYSGLKDGAKELNHTKLAGILKNYLDGLLNAGGVQVNWINDYVKILDTIMGAPPKEFYYNGKTYTPKTFSKEVLKFNATDYVNLTSFTHHPFYAPFILEVPDNFSNGSYYNIPMDEMIGIVKSAIQKGYTVMWDADISNGGFQKDNGIAVFGNFDFAETTSPINSNFNEPSWNTSLRQQYFERLVTQDDHLMHITGIEKSTNGKPFFLVKNSWGSTFPYRGYIHVSENYFAMNTISLVLPKAALDILILQKLGIK